MTGACEHHIDVAVIEGDWDDRVGLLARRAAAATLAVAAPREKRELSLALADDATVQQLNRDYCGRDAPTNVLAFTSGDTGARVPLGDVVVAATTVAREAGEQHKSFDDHFCHLVIHGTLHLLGHDHADDDAAARMEALEREILATLGIADPYGDTDRGGVTS